MVEKTEFDSHINIKSATSAKDCSTYLMKEIKLENLKLSIETPYKIIEGKKINKNDISDYAKDIVKPIFESGIFVSKQQSYSHLYNILEENKTSEIASFLGFRKSLLESNGSKTAVSFVFSRNPFVENVFGKDSKITKLPPMDKDNYEYTLLDHIHSASKALILSPDIKIMRNNKKQIELDDYLKYIDNNLKILSEFNKTPIFAPIQIDINSKWQKKILAHYRKNGYTNIWINFNGSHIGGIYFTRVRTLCRYLKDIIGFKNVVLYESHIHREIKGVEGADITNEKVIGSDILSQFFAADFIGVNRDPPPPPMDDSNIKKIINKLIQEGKIKDEKEYYEVLTLNKQRLFDPDSYYYYRVDKYPHNLSFDGNQLLNTKKNKLYNSTLIYNEIEATKKKVREEKNIKPYIKNKKALEENKVQNQKISDFILASKDKTKQTNLFEKLGKFG